MLLLPPTYKSNIWKYLLKIIHYIFLFSDSQSAPTEEEKTESSGQTDPAPPAAHSPPRKRGRPRKQQVERELLDTQRSQFDVLHRDLVVLRRSISRMESRTVPLLRSISKSLERMADAFDYITAPATDGLLNSGLLNNTSWNTLCPLSVFVLIVFDLQSNSIALYKHTPHTSNCTEV